MAEPRGKNLFAQAGAVDGSAQEGRGIDVGVVGGNGIVGQARAVGENGRRIRSTGFRFRIVRPFVDIDPQRIKESKENAKKFLDRVRLCSLAESLGGVETLISHPESMTHGSVPPETRKRLGITPGLVRISVGIEDLEDLIGDLDNAFEGV